MEIALIAAIVIAAFYYKNKTVQSLTPIVVAVYNRCNSNAEMFSAGNGLTHYVTADQILAVICQESGTEISKGISNQNIVGDNNNAFGVMQLHQIALDQVNALYGSAFSLSDIRISEQDNIQAGACYLDWCLMQTSNNEVEAFSMYNGSNMNYANSVMNYLQSIKEVKQNGISA